MRNTGILRRWDDERGFGFIAPAQGGAELFVHISAFPADGSRPTAGETLIYEPGRGRDGRPQALKVVRAAVGRREPGPARLAAPRRGSSGSRLGTLAVLALVLVAGAFGYRSYRSFEHRMALEAQPAGQPVLDQPLLDPPALAPLPLSPPVPGQPAAPHASFRCDGRTQCSQMSSCAEATWFINNCPGTKMDGDHDGVPCEQQWCSR